MILLTFDVEDWFQVENFKSCIKYDQWDSLDLRVERNTRTILDLLDSFRFKPRATFFILGWIADRFPQLIKEIHQRGHEVASHGYHHHLCTQLKEKELIRDLLDSRQLLERIIHARVTGFRAPSFAVNDDIIRGVKRAGYAYDSSYNSFSGHDRYGTIDLSGTQQIGSVWKLGEEFYELPVSNLGVGQVSIPLGGGGYFRLYPFSIFKQGMKQVLKKEKAFVFYAHPWEFDRDQPRVEQASTKSRFRHYTNLDKTEGKLRKLIQAFRDHQFLTCSEYIAKNAPLFDQ